MPWKLLGFILLTAIVLTFVGFNLENRGDISVVFYTFRNVPVVITLLSSFLFGLLVAFFFSLGRAMKSGARKAGPSSAPQKSAIGQGSDEPFHPETAKVARGKSRVKTPHKPEGAEKNRNSD